MQFAPKRIECQAERFERECAEEIAVARLAEDLVRAADKILETKLRDTFAPRNLRPIGQPEVLGFDRLYAEVVENRRGHNAIDGAGVNEKFD